MPLCYLLRWWDDTELFHAITLIIFIADAISDIDYAAFSAIIIFDCRLLRLRRWVPAIAWPYIDIGHYAAADGAEPRLITLHWCHCLYYIIDYAADILRHYATLIADWLLLSFIVLRHYFRWY